MDVLKTVREIMAREGINIYIADTFDPHGNEYVNDYFKVRELLTGFTGSNGIAVIFADEAYLWTDGRYFIQAESELYPGYTLMKAGMPGVMTVFSFIEKRLKKGTVISYDGSMLSLSKALELKKIADKKKAVIKEFDLVKDTSLVRSKINYKKIFLLDSCYAGISYIKKIQNVRKKMKAEGTDCLVISKLDEIMWLLNIRGADIECNPVAYSYLLVTKDLCRLYINKCALFEKACEYFDINNIEIADYNDALSDIEGFLKKNRFSRVTTDFRYVSGQFMPLTCEYKIINSVSPIELMKAIKNPVEIKNLKKCYLKDSAVLTRYLHYIKNTPFLNEYEAAQRLDKMRSEIDDFISLSFPTISAYGANAAMMHYEADKEHNSVIEDKGLYLVDSGGQYLSGTTDVTRTVMMGEISGECKIHFTLTVISMLRLMNLKFISGSTGRNIDVIARAPFWERGMDYKCGTGHGIGYLLNVHEGPLNISYGKRKGSKEPKIESGMIVSDEPGAYIEGRYGIRIENILLAKKYRSTDDGDFLCFEPLTYVPIDLDAIDISVMEKKDIENLNNYHKAVYRKLKPFFDKNELVWLKEATKNIG